MTPPPASSLPIVLLPIGTDDDALDACLGALDAGTPAGTRLWLADDAQAGPRALAIIERWLTRTSLQADYTRRPRMLGEVAHMDQMLAACGDVDVVVLSPDAQPLPFDPSSKGEVVGLEIPTVELAGATFKVSFVFKMKVLNLLHSCSLVTTKLHPVRSGSICVLVQVAKPRSWLQRQH